MSGWQTPAPLISEAWLQHVVRVAISPSATSSFATAAQDAVPSLFSLIRGNVPPWQRMPVAAVLGVQWLHS